MTTFLFVDNQIPDLSILSDAFAVPNSQFDSNTIVNSSLTRIGFIWENRSDRIPFGSTEWIMDSETNKVSKWFSNEFVQYIGQLAVDTIIDLITCRLNSKSFNSELAHLKSLYPHMIINYSIDITGNGSHENWIMESSGEDISTIYFNDKLSLWTKNLLYLPYFSPFNYKPVKLTTPGTLININNSAYAPYEWGPLNNVIYVASNWSNSYAALLPINGENRNVVAWGNDNDNQNTGGGDSYQGVLGALFGITNIYNASAAFCALRNDGRVIAWGRAESGGDNSSVYSSLVNVVDVCATDRAFAALKSGGSVITWGNSGYGGNSAGVAESLSSGVVKIFSSHRAFAALKSDGSVITWGDEDYGGDSSYVYELLSSEVKTIVSTMDAFAALKIDGSVVTWGSSDTGGDSSSVASLLLSNVANVFATAYGFAALKHGGRVITWGSVLDGGDSSRVASLLLSGVNNIYCNTVAFTAVKYDGTLVFWGGYGYAPINYINPPASISNIINIIGTNNAFAALKSDGTVITWGHVEYGGDSSDVAGSLTNVQTIVSSYYSFAAIQMNGNVITWGATGYGGNTGSVGQNIIYAYGLNNKVYLQGYYDEEVGSRMLPQSPYNMVVSTLNTRATINFTAGSDGYQEILYYEYSIDYGYSWHRIYVYDSHLLYIIGLVNKNYYIMLRAVNSVGASEVTGIILEDYVIVCCEKYLRRIPCQHFGYFMHSNYLY